MSERASEEDTQPHSAREVDWKRERERRGKGKVKEKEIRGKDILEGEREGERERLERMGKGKGREGRGDHVILTLHTGTSSTLNVCLYWNVLLWISCDTNSCDVLYLR